MVVEDLGQGARIQGRRFELGEGQEMARMIHRTARTRREKVMTGGAAPDQAGQLSVHELFRIAGCHRVDRRSACGADHTRGNRAIQEGGSRGPLNQAVSLGNIVSVLPDAGIEAAFLLHIPEHAAGGILGEALGHEVVADILGIGRHLRRGQGGGPRTNRGVGLAGHDASAVYLGTRPHLVSAPSSRRPVHIGSVGSTAGREVHIVAGQLDAVPAGGGHKIDLGIGLIAAPGVNVAVVLAGAGAVGVERKAVVHIGLHEHAGPQRVNDPGLLIRAAVRPEGHVLVVLQAGDAVAVNIQALTCGNIGDFVVCHDFELLSTNRSRLVVNAFVK